MINFQSWNLLLIGWNGSYLKPNLGRSGRGRMVCGCRGWPQWLSNPLFMKRSKLLKRLLHRLLERLWHRLNLLLQLRLLLRLYWQLLQWQMLQWQLLQRQLLQRQLLQWLRVLLCGSQWRLHQRQLLCCLLLSNLLLSPPGSSISSRCFEQNYRRAFLSARRTRAPRTRSFSFKAWILLRFSSRPAAGRRSC